MLNSEKCGPRHSARARFRSPLLVLDEAHHLKNPATRLASLFVTDDAQEDVRTISGALEGAFERMMFLQPTPFQLGHHELLNVISRFKGVAWKTFVQHTNERFETELKELGAVLDHAQHRTGELDIRWRSLHPEDLVGPDSTPRNVEEWWREAMQKSEAQPERIQVVIRALEEARKAMKNAEVPLRRWVIRHLRDRHLPNSSIPRRLRLVGRALALSGTGDGGLPVEGAALLPFLLAARAQAVIIRDGEKAGRATFAEGLASSYEAFLYTRNDFKVDEEPVSGGVWDKRVNRYIEKLTGVF